MSQYVFPCCSRTVTLDGVSSATVQVPHLCVGDQTCIGIANISAMNPVQAAIADVQTEVEAPGTTQVVGTDGEVPGGVSL